MIAQTEGLAIPINQHLLHSHIDPAATRTSNLEHLLIVTHPLRLQSLQKFVQVVGMIRAALGS